MSTEGRDLSRRLTPAEVREVTRDGVGWVAVARTARALRVGRRTLQRAIAGAPLRADTIRKIRVGLSRNALHGNPGEPLAARAGGEP